jgi:hypothetical protein
MGKLMAKLQIVVLTPYFPPRRHRSGFASHSSQFAFSITCERYLSVTNKLPSLPNGTKIATDNKTTESLR